MKRLQISGILALFILSLLFSCSGNPAAPSDGTAPVNFALDPDLHGISPDSMAVTITIGDTGQPQSFTYDWRVNAANRSIKASIGEKFRLEFKIFACKFTVALGDTQGTFQENMAVILHPNWNDSDLAKAKVCRNSAQCLVSDPSLYFNLALAGKRFDIATDCDSIAAYRWVMSRKGDTVLTGEGPRISFVVPESLNGSEVSLKVQLLLHDSVTEVRTWTIAILSGFGNDRPQSILWKNDTTSNTGTSVVFHYDGSKLITISIFDTLAPTNALTPTVVESLTYTSDGQLKETKARQPDSTVLDSIFTHDGMGRLVSLRIAGGASILLDTLIYGAGMSPLISLQYAAGDLQDSVLYAYISAQERDDSVFSTGKNGMALARVILNTYRNDSLTKRQVLVEKNGLFPFKSEKFVYNGLGSLAYRQVFTDGGSPVLEETDGYQYDNMGRLARILIKDEVLGEVRFAAYYQYAATMASPEAEKTLQELKDVERNMSPSER